MANPQEKIEWKELPSGTIYYSPQNPPPACLSSLSDDPSSSWVATSLHSFRSDQRTIKCFDRWKCCGFAGIPEVKVLIPKRGEILALTEECNDSLISLLTMEIKKWEDTVKPWNDSKSYWWIYISDFFIKTFRQVFIILINIYQAKKFHGSIVMDHIHRNKRGQIKMFIWPGEGITTDAKISDITPEYLRRELLQLKSLMVEVIHKPFEATPFNVIEYGLPADLVQLFTDLEAQWDFDRVKIRFLMDCPLFWKKEEMLTFFSNMNVLTCQTENLRWSVLFASMALPNDWAEQWIRDEDSAILKHWMQSGLAHNAPNIIHFIDNLLSHFNDFKGQYDTMSKQDILLRVMSIHPKLFSLPSMLRRSIMDLANEGANEGADEVSDWVWCQLQLLTSTRSPAVRR